MRWLDCMVYDPALVTDERVDERWEAAMAPSSHESLAAMYGSAAVAAQQRALEASEAPPYWSMMRKIQCPTLFTWGLDDRQCPRICPSFRYGLCRMPNCTSFPTAGTG